MNASLESGHGRSAGTGRLSRRRFLGSALLGAASVTIAPRHVLGGAGYAPPSEKLRIAGVGIGGMGSGNLDGLSSQDIVALCDVDEKYAAGSFRRYPNAARYADFRLMLEKEKGIEAVMIATPDHMHAPIALAAIELGKHVYCEKPLTHTVREARELAEAARKKGVATQMGNRGQASEGTKAVCEWVAAGVIGRVHEVHLWTDRPMKGVHGIYWPQGMGRPVDTPAVPETLTWDLWLGVAPRREYHPSYLPFVWRGWLDFGTGALGDIGCHSLDTAFRALALGAPESVEASSTPVNDESFPLASIVTYRFPARGEMPPVKLVWYDGGLRPSRPLELAAGRRLGGFTNGQLYVGEKGTIMTRGPGADPVLLPESLAKDFEPPAKTLPRSPGHYEEWIRSCKGGPAAGSSFDHAGPLTETVLLGNVALRRELREKLARGPLVWDSKAMRFPNCPEADAFVHKEYRAEFTL